MAGRPVPSRRGWVEESTRRLNAVIDAAQRGCDGEAIARAGRLLVRVGEVAENCRAIDKELVELEGSSSGTEPRTVRLEPVARPDAGARARSVAAWRHLIEGIVAAGVPMTRVSEAVYRTSSGSRVAMPFSKEIEPGKWWLGSYEGRFDEVILLCEVDEGVQAFHLSRGFLGDHLAGLSRDASGNVKFNLDRIGGRMTLRLGHGSSTDLRRFDPSSDARGLGAR